MPRGRRSCLRQGWSPVLARRGPETWLCRRDGSARDSRWARARCGAVQDLHARGLLLPNPVSCSSEFPGGTSCDNK